MQVSALEGERARAAQEAQAAQQRAAELQEGKRRFEWQSALLQRLMEVQLKHNKTKTQSLRCGGCQPWPLHAAGSQALLQATAACAHKACKFSWAGHRCRPAMLGSDWSAEPTLCMT